MKRFMLFIFWLYSILTWGQPEIRDANVMVGKVDRSFFIENIGQWPEEVLYLARLGGMNVWITRDGMVMDFYQLEGRDKMMKHDPVRMLDDRMEEDVQVKGHVVRMKWVGSLEPLGEGRGKHEGYYNYFIGNDSSRWVSYVGLYDEVMVSGIYPGVDVRYYFDEGKVRFDFELAAGVDPSVIRWVIEGAEEEEVVDDELRFRTRFGWVSLMDLRAFQGDRDLVVGYRKNSEVWSFEVGGYDRSMAMVIDPLIWSTFIGGNGHEVGNVIKVDGNGFVYVTGWTWSNDFPVTTGSYDETQNGYYDIFVTKLNPMGSPMVYSTFIGGNGWDESKSLVLDNVGNVYLTGLTESTDYPVTLGAYDNTYNGGYYDVFITKLNAQGSELKYSTFIGGNGTDFGFSLAIDGNKNLYVAGGSSSTDFPVTSGAYDESYNGGNYDAFVIKINISDSTLVYSTFVGGVNSDCAGSIALDDSGFVYIYGSTYSSDFPVTSGAYDVTHNGGSDVFVTKLNLSGSGLVYSTLIGGSEDDDGVSLAVNGNGEVYLTGRTWSTDYPVTPGGYDVNYNGGDVDIFVTKLNVLGNELEYSTYLGGNGWDESSSLALDSVGNVYLTGFTESADYPVTLGAYSYTFNGGYYDIFITKLNSQGNGLEYSTFIGGSGEDQGCSISLDLNNDVYVTGLTFSADYPVTSGAYDESYNGSRDLFVFKLSIGGISSITSANNHVIRIYPNPTDKEIKVIAKIDKVMDVKLIDVLNREMNIQKDKKGEEEFVLRVEEIPCGIYFVHIIGNGWQQVEKVVIER